MPHWTSEPDRLIGVSTRGLGSPHATEYALLQLTTANWKPNKRTSADAEPESRRAPPMAHAHCRAARVRRCRLSLLKAISDTVQRFDHVELAVAGFELFAQSLDVTVDGAVIDINLIVIGRIH